MIERLDRISNEGKPVCPEDAAVPQPAGIRRTMSADRIIVALAVGTLLGALAAMPYDRLLGVSQPACTILRSALTTAVWAGLGSERLRNLVFDPGALLAALSIRQTRASCRAEDTR
jgi:hypothetical protein